MKKILLIEDNDGDQDLLKMVLKKSVALDIVDDGVKALNFLRNETSYLPDLIILDLNLPKKTGKEVLAEIKSDPNLKKIPVIIFTTSSAEHDIKACYDLHANSYFIKPNTYSELVKVIEKIKDYWLSTVKLPS